MKAINPLGKWIKQHGTTRLRELSYITGITISSIYRYARIISECSVVTAVRLEEGTREMIKIHPQIKIKPLDRKMLCVTCKECPYTKKE